MESKNALDRIMGKVLQSAEDDSWKEKVDVTWTATLTYEHGGAYYCFRLEKAERDERHPHGITEETIREIAAALPKRLKPLTDGIGRRFTFAASRTESKRQRKL
jgi:hypothetical protein